MPFKVFKDPNTFSNTDLFQIDHIGLNWTIDFHEKIIKGSCTLDFGLVANPATKNDHIILDSRDLEISSVECEDELSKTQLGFEIEKGNEFGQALKISLSNLANISDLKKLRLNIVYNTSRKGASALQWMNPSQTMGQRHPYLFSQCQAIHARSIVPCQDTPSVKVTYSASVTVKRPLQVLMSAIQKGDPISVSDDLIRYEYEQPVRIPSYLLAIVVGDLVSKDIGPRSRVWTEKEMLEKSAYEFAEVENMLKDAESIMGEYVWGRYDILVLPPTFPYGGMENPCLTFVTPTIIAGDRSLASVIQHEITHSWTGNLVTNCSWEHFWLNEGFTRCIENKLVALQNKSEIYRQFELIESWRALIDAVEVFGPTNQLTKLVPNLSNIDPDDAFSSIPYEKGQFLLLHLEQILGGIDVFNKYLRAHIEKFKGLSIDTDTWKAYLYEYFSDKKDILDKVDWQGWLHTAGMPPCTFEFDKTISDQVRQLAEKLYNENVSSIDPVFSTFNSNQKRELLSQLLDKEPLSKEKIESLNEHYKFGDTQNSEILFRWLRLGIKAKWAAIVEPALKFVRDQGRMKFTRPVYRDLYNWEESRAAAIDNFQKYRIYMHSTTAGLVAKDLKL